MRTRAAAATAALRDVLRNPSIRRIELAWTAGTAADWAFLVILLVFVYAEGGTLAVGLLGAVRIVPAIPAARFAPLLVERYLMRTTRRPMMVQSSQSLPSFCPSTGGRRSRQSTRRIDSVDPQFTRFAGGASLRAGVDAVRRGFRRAKCPSGPST
jgi:hypothetical protein